MTHFNPLSVLGLPVGSTIEEARNRYKELAKKNHPDKGCACSDRFLEIKEAINALEHDSTLLNQKGRHMSAAAAEGDDLWVFESIKIEEAVFMEEIKVVAKPKKKCPQCKGTGASDIRYHTCKMCDGKGVLAGEIVRMALGSNTCPDCSGTGIKIPHLMVCKLCKGTSLAQYTTMKPIKAGNAMVTTGKADFVFKGEGHEGPFGGPPGDLHISIEVQGSAGFEYLDGKAVLWAEISPAMYVSGCEVCVELLGERIKATMQPMTGRADVEFRGKKLQIRASLVIPYNLPKEQITQYQILRELEKRQKSSGIGGIQHEVSNPDKSANIKKFRKKRPKQKPIKQEAPGRRAKKL